MSIMKRKRRACHKRKEREGELGEATFGYFVQINCVMQWIIIVGIFDIHIRAIFDQQLQHFHRSNNPILLLFILNCSMKWGFTIVKPINVQIVFENELLQ